MLKNLFLRTQKPMSPLQEFLSDSEQVCAFLEQEGLGENTMLSEEYSSNTGRLRVYLPDSGAEVGWFIQTGPDGLIFTPEGPYQADPTEW